MDYTFKFEKNIKNSKNNIEKYLLNFEVGKYL